MSSIETFRRLARLSTYSGLAAMAMCTAGLVWGTSLDGREKDAGTVRTASILAGAGGLLLSGAGIASDAAIERRQNQNHNLNSGA